VNVPRPDAAVRFVSGASSRRRFLGGVSATALALVATRGLSEVEAKKRHKKRKKKVRADAICSESINDAFGIVDVNSRLAQTFTAIASGKLVRAELRLTEPAGSLGDYVLRLSTVNGAGFPTNSVLAAAEVLDLDVPSGQSTVTFTFDSPASVVAGTDYALVLTRPGADELVWAGHTGNSCDGTAFLSPTQNDPFVAVGNIDFVFKTFVKS
jgi:hypothetical protein